MVKGVWRRRKTEDENEEQFSFFFTNERIQEIIRSVPLRDFVDAQYLKYIGHVGRLTNKNLTKIMLFAQPGRRYYRDPWLKISNLLGISSDRAKKLTQARAEFVALIG